MNYLVKTRPPFSILLLILIAIITISEAVSNPGWLVYSIPFYIIFYVLFCRYCYVVSITAYEFHIHYFAPWQKDIDIKVEDIINVDYEKGYYDPRARKRIGPYDFLRYCYDRLIIRQKDEENPIIFLNVNTRVFDFSMILKWAVGEQLLDKV